MTTIVYDHKNKQIACDSRTTNGYMITNDKAVKWLDKDSIKWFLSGRRGENLTFVTNFKELDAANEALDNFGFFIDDKVVYLANISEGYFRSCDMVCNKGIGSGGDFAMAALDFGKTAKEAVEYAITKDYCSGGKVHVYDIEKGKFL